MVGLRATMEELESGPDISWQLGTLPGEGSEEREDMNYYNYSNNNHSVGTGEPRRGSSVISLGQVLAE